MSLSATTLASRSTARYPTSSLLQNTSHVTRLLHLVDVKTLGAGQTYHSNSITFGNVVETRQLKVNTDYHSSARRLDTRRGPFVSTLFEYGIGGRVLGPVVGAFGEASSDLVVSAISALTRSWNTTE